VREKVQIPAVDSAPFVSETNQDTPEILATAGFRLLAQNVTKNAPFLVIVVLLRAVHLFGHTFGLDRQGNQLRMCVLERAPAASRGS